MTNHKNNLDIEENEQRDSGSFDTTGLLLDYLSNWKWFVLCAIVAVAISYYKYSTIIPTYTVSASIYLDKQNSDTKSNAISLNNAGALIDTKSYIDETEIEILKSKNSLVEIVDSLNLAYQYYYIGKLRDVPVYRTSPIVVSLDSMSLKHLGGPIEVLVTKNGNNYDIEAGSVWGDGSERIKKTVQKLPLTLNMPQGELTIDLSPTASNFEGTNKVVISNPTSAAARLAANLDIAYAQNSTTILRMTFNTPIIDEGKDIINVLLDIYNKRIVEDKNRSAVQTEAFILDRLVMISSELRDVEDRLRDYRQTHNIVNLEAQTSMSLTQKNTGETQLAQLGAQEDILHQIELLVKNHNGYDMLPEVTNNQVLSTGIAKYNSMVTNYRHACESQTNETEYVRTLETALDRQKSQILDNINAVRSEYAAQRRMILKLEDQSINQMAAEPTLDKGLQEIFREQQVKVNIYTFLLQRREEIALQKTLATPTAQLIDNPAGSGPVAPNQSNYLLIGLLVGLVIPAVIILLRRLFFPTFKDQDELERLTEVPILGEISVNEGGENIVVGKNVSTPVAELFRLLRSNINFIKTEGKSKVILVTSSISGEGKTFISVNLATTYALIGKRVIVVGMDVRRPMLAKMCHGANNAGVTTYLSGQTDDIHSLIIKTDICENLDVLPGGPIPPNPNELLLSDNMPVLMEYLRDNYDVVIIDSAPIGMVSDTYLIVQHSDIQIYVTRAGFSTRKGLKVMHNAVNNGRLPHPYLVLNGVEIASNTYIYRRYGKYGYGTYGYTYGYGDDKESSRSKWFLKRLLKRHHKKASKK
jgi:capsular exopolysaccharide synthesis family protein